MINLIKIKNENDILLSSPSNNKYNSFIFISEYDDLYKTLLNNNFKISGVDNIFISTIRKPVKVSLDKTYLKNLQSLNYKISHGSFSDLGFKIEANNIIDMSLLIKSINNKYNINKNNKKALSIINLLLSSIPKIGNKYNKILIYQLGKNIKLKESKFFAIYIQLLRNRFQNKNIPFDKLVFFKDNKFTLVFDKNQNMDIDFIKSFFQEEPVRTKISNNKNYYEDEEEKSAIQKYLDFKKNKKSVKEGVGGVLASAGINSGFALWDAKNMENERVTRTDELNASTENLKAAADTFKQLTPASQAEVNRSQRNIGVAALATVGIYGAFKAAEYIRDLMEKRKWKNEGCLKIKDPYKYKECIVYNMNVLLRDLKIAKSKCKDEACNKKFDEQIKRMVIR
jgi:hypothetical protein